MVSTGMKVVAAAVICLIVGVAGGYFLGAGTVAPTTVTRTVTTTVTGVTTPTVTITPTPKPALNIVYIGSLTGGLAVYGESVRRGIDLAVSEINEAQGIDGRKTNVVVYDDASNTQQTISLTTKAIQEDKPHVVMYGVASGAAIAAGRLLQEAKVPHMIIYSSHPNSTVGRDYSFRVHWSDPVTANIGANFLFKELGVKKLALFVMQLDFTVNVARMIKEQAAKYGASVVFERAFPFGTKDFRAFITALQGTDADGLYIAALYAEAAAILVQMRELGLPATKIPTLITSGMDTPYFLKIAGEAAEGSYRSASLIVDENRPVVQKFVKSYRAKYSGDPDFAASEAYMGVYLLAEAVKKKGTEPAAIRDGLMDVKDYEATFGRMAGWTPMGPGYGHELVYQIRIVKYEGGVDKIVKTYAEPEIINPYTR